ncbi:MAG: hypothetical protein WCZ89_07330 [Phycisphaerae bacterium]
MDLILGQLILAARRNDGDESGWVQLLVFLVLGVFWAVGGIMKARADKEAKKKQLEAEEISSEPTQQRPVRRYTIQRQPKPQMTPESRPVIRQSTPISRPMARPAPIYKQTSRFQKPSPISRSTFDKRLPKVSRYTEKQIEPAAPKVIPQENVTDALAVSQKPLVALDSLEELRAAILHYEILGHPVALRESDEQTWMR